MASRYYLLKPCRTTPAYISTPKAALHLDLADARAKLEGEVRGRGPDEGVDVVDGGLGHPGSVTTGRR